VDHIGGRVEGDLVIGNDVRIGFAIIRELHDVIALRMLEEIKDAFFFE